MWWFNSKTLHVGLSSQRLVIAGTDRASTANTPGRYVADFAKLDSLQAWLPAIEALKKHLESHQGTSLNLRVVLSGRFVRWQLLDRPFQLVSSVERSNYAKLRFGDTFGKEAANWQIASSIQPPSTKEPACAIDKQLLLSLQDICKPNNADLISVVPQFSLAFDYLRPALVGQTIWFGLVETDCVSLGLLLNGRWQALQSLRHDGDWRKRLQEMMAQLAVSVGILPESPTLYLAGSKGAEDSARVPGAVWLNTSLRNKPEFSALLPLYAA